MFNLDHAIIEWRRQVAEEINDADALDELESHLRDDIERHTRAGQSEEKAFEMATENLGRADALQKEFAKVALQGWFKRAFSTLVGIPNSQLATNMNNVNVEPRWATYIKASTFVMPAIFLWTVSMLFIFPKLQQITRDAGTVIPDPLRLPFFLAQHGGFIAGAIILTLLLLEWRSRQWPQYRRAAVGITVFMLNATVMVAITMMVILAILVAPALAHLQINR